MFRHIVHCTLLIAFEAAICVLLISIINQLIDYSQGAQKQNDIATTDPSRD
jgi:hypothetical protein